METKKNEEKAEEKTRSGALHPGGGGVVGSKVNLDRYDEKESTHIPVDLGEGEG